MAFETNVYTMTLPAHDDLSGSQYLCITVNGTSGNADVAGAGAKCIGVLQNEPSTGQAASVRVMGITKAISGAAVTVGDAVASDAAGKVVTQATTAVTVGVALEAAGGADEIISVLLLPGGEIGAS